ncbi:MAG: nucleotidyl transferase AbiEii/AbiGii toxin family protein [Chlamydiae bacterium]|nr:nucleotidyl transferase AbiEii/AbiGii toxin family protein [Chlamydiota bacterium]
MNRRNIINIPASIRDKLLNKSRILKCSFLELLQYYSIERFLYRLSISKHAHKFFLKGALMFRAWHMMDHRATIDVDLLGKTKNTIQNLENICKEICKQSILIEDGITFSSNSVKGKIIQTEAEYDGIRIEFEGELNKAVISMQIDIGFGDIIIPGPKLISYPTILDFPAPQMKGYTLESVIAEKLETMIKRGMSNSRMKDVFDIWTLSKRFSLSSKSLAKAIEVTFQQRGTSISSNPECFSEEFMTNLEKNKQWQSFIRKKNLLNMAPISLAEAVEHIKRFLNPILYGININNLPELKWHPPHYWTGHEIS